MFQLFLTYNFFLKHRFIDTIIGLRYWQLHLPSHDNDTMYAVYMNESFQRIRSLLPIYFDRTRTYAHHCYGINTSLSLKLNENATFDGKNVPTSDGQAEDMDHNKYDSIVVDFLYRQDKSDGPSMVIGIVLDAISTSNLHVERGFCLDRKNMETKKSDDARILWPAIYLRSTMHLPTPGPPPKSDAGGSGIFTSSQASLLSNWATNGTSHGLSIPGGSPFSMSSRKQPLIGISPTTTPPSHRKSKTLSLSSAPQLPFSDSTVSVTESTTAILCSNWHALEYGPESGNVTTWPHSDWVSIARILNDQNVSDKISESVRAAMNVHSNAHMNKPTNDDTDLVQETETPLSTVYNLHLGPFLNLIVMVKRMDHDSRLSQLRQKQMKPDDIKKFMKDTLAPSLRVSTIFSMAYITPLMLTLVQPTPSKDTKNRIAASSKVKTELYLPTSSVGISLLSSSSFWSNEHQVQDFLSMIKSSFGLRPSSPMRNSSRMANRHHNTSLLWGTPRTPTEVMKNFQQRRDLRSYNSRSEMASAAVFFLGPELASSFDE
jgi:hypothetical protein